MRHKVFLILANTGLLAVVVALLSGPLLLGQLLGSSVSGTLGVTDSTPQTRQLLVYPNETDFSHYASFNPSPVIENLFYQTSVTFTTFADQQAVYNGLFTLYNPGATPLTVQAETGNLSGQVDGSQIWLTLSPTEHSAVTLVTESAAQGANEIVVADTTSFKQGAVFIGEQQVEAVRKSQTRLRLASPLAKAVTVGDKVYLGAIFYNKQLEAAASQTQSITLPPHGRAVLTLTVATVGEGDQEQVVLPLAITAK